MRYDTHAANGSMYNTPNCWAIYVCGKVFKYLKSIGGLEAMEREVKKLQEKVLRNNLYYLLLYKSHKSF